MTLASIPFIFIFLPAFLCLYLPFKNTKWRKIILVLFSLIFFVWNDIFHIHILLISLLVNFVSGIILGLLIKSQTHHLIKPFLLFGIISNLLILGFYKFSDTGLTILALLSNYPVNEIIPPQFPLGISYFTFTGLSYIFDVYYRKITPEFNLLDFSTYYLMFPKITQGPITRYKEITKTPTININNLADGIHRFIYGLFKKVFIADNLAIIADQVFNTNYKQLPEGIAWIGLLAFSLQIYIDFSSYTDMAIGIGKMLGFDLPENFNFPYISKTITEFWRRWHITLTSWFRDYVFSPLEFKNRRTKKWYSQAVNIAIVFLLTGLWHGSTWNYILWGGYFGILLIIESFGLGKFLKKLPVFLQHIYTLLFIALGWMIFRTASLEDCFLYFKAIFGFSDSQNMMTLISLNVVQYLPFIFIGIVLSIPMKISDYLTDNSHQIKQVLQGAVSIILFVIAIAYLLNNEFTPFLYIAF